MHSVKKSTRDYYNLVHQNINNCLKTIPQQPNTVPPASIEVNYQLTDRYFKTYVNNTFPFTSKPREWFSKIRLQISVSYDSIRLRYTTQCAS